LNFIVRCDPSFVDMETGFTLIRGEREGTDGVYYLRRNGI